MKSQAFTIAGFAIGVLAAAPTPYTAASTAELPIPSSADSGETAVSGITGVVVTGDKWFATTSDAATHLSGTYRADAQTKEERFGLLVDSTRHPVAKVGEGTIWTGVADADRALLALDGANLMVMAVDRDSGREISRRSIPWDTLRPPRDRGGEANRHETARLRARFERALKATRAPAFVGIAPAPREWLPTQLARAFLIATRVPGFPIIALACGDADLTECRIERACTVEGSNDLAPQDVTGIAVDVPRRRVFVGDQQHHQLAVFQMNSCLNVRRTATLALPTRLKTLGALHVDRANALWVTTLRADDYENASLFRWADVP